MTVGEITRASVRSDGTVRPDPAVRGASGWAGGVVRAGALLRRMGTQDITANDPRLGLLVQRLPSPCSARATLKERLRFIASAKENLRSPRGLAGTLCSLQAALDNMDSLSLDEELEALILPPPGRNREIMLQRLGWHGAGPATLESIGREYGITRERVRQVCAAVMRARECTAPYAPRLDAALRIIAQTAPAPTEDVDAALHQHGIFRGAMRLGDLLAASRLIGRPEPDVEVDDLLIVPRASGGSAQATGAQILKAARAAVWRWGMTTFADVAASVCGGWDEAASLRAVQAVLRTEEDLCLLDEDRGWFFLRTMEHNSLTMLLAKILCVTSPIHVSDLRAALGRPHRVRAQAPPQRALLRLCEELPGYAVDGSFVRAQPPLDRSHVLVGAEAQMAEVLTRHGGVMRREEFERQCVFRGVNRNTFRVYLSHAPFICRRAPKIYGLPGAHVEPGVVEQLAAKRIRTRVVVRQGRVGDGRI